MINIDELHKEKDKKLKHKNEVYDIVLKKCHQRIKTTAKILDGNDNCLFVVPPYIYGCPLYNINNCIFYLVNQLTQNGFDVKHINPNFLYISWEGKKNPKNFKTLQKNEKRFKSIEDFKPTNNFVYDNKTLDVFKKKLF
jgi:hypothetical protein